MKAKHLLLNPAQAHRIWCELWSAIKGETLQGHRLEVTVKPQRRTNDQNAAQWPILEAFAQQLQWPVNGQMVHMTAEEWKDVLTAGFRKERVRVAMGLDGGVVMLGLRTSKMDKAEFSEWLDFLNATAALRGVELQERA
jgi:hypothetical protein